jgi:hypothetical protein
MSSLSGFGRWDRSDLCPHDLSATFEVPLLVLAPACPNLEDSLTLSGPQPDRHEARLF